MRRWCVFVLLAGCSRQVQPATPQVAVDPGEPAVGHRIPIASSWSGTCEETELARTFEKDTSHAEQWGCAGQKYRLEVKCSTTCRIATGDFDAGAPTVGAAVSSSGASGLSVIPMTVGPLEIEVTMKDPAGYVVASYKSPPLVVRAPDALGLYCFYPHIDQYGDLHDADYLVPCDGRPLAHQKPFVWPVASYGKSTYPLPMASLNGVDKLSARTLKLAPVYENVRSLADAFPARVTGGSLQPGHYDVTIAVGDVTSTVPVEVQ